MAYDKVVDSAFLEAGLTLVGDSIRAKGGTSAKLEFPNGMKAAVEAINTSKPEQTKTATPSLSQQTISPDSGKVLSGVTVEPITSTLLTSLDPDFKAENIAEGVDMFGVAGTHAGGAAVETCTVTFEGSGRFNRLYYTTLENGEYTYVSSNVGFGSSSVTVLKDSILYVYGSGSGRIAQLQGGVSSLCDTYNYALDDTITGIYDDSEGHYYGILHITDDCTIESTDPGWTGS